jgi:tripartite-type tricarboxylate transporter receptor subunit TctC
VNAWNGILAPAKTPKPILERLYRAIAAVIKNADFINELKARDVEPLLVGPSEFSAYIRRESAKWGKVIKAGRITAE